MCVLGVGVGRQEGKGAVEEVVEEEEEIMQQKSRAQQRLMLCSPLAVEKNTHSSKDT